MPQQADIDSRQIERQTADREVRSEARRWHEALQQNSQQIRLMDHGTGCGKVVDRDRHSPLPTESRQGLVDANRCPRRMTHM